MGRGQRSDERKIFTSHVAAGRVREQQRAKGVVRNLLVGVETQMSKGKANQPQRGNVAGHWCKEEEEEQTSNLLDDRLENGRDLGKERVRLQKFHPDVVGHFGLEQDLIMTVS